MGWTFIKNATREDVVLEIIKETKYFRTIHYCVKYDTVYALHETVKGDSRLRWIGVHLMQDDPDYGWGYKSMDESMGPYEIDCPISYIDEASDPVNELAANWRSKVRRNSNEK